MSEPQTQSPKKSTEASVVILINNQERIENILVPETNQMLVIMPGLNLVEPSALAACLKNDMFSRKFETKIPKSFAKEAEHERVGEPMLVQGKTVSASAPFAKIDDVEAKELVERINLEEIIDRILAKEGRSEIRAALDNRRRFIQTGEQTASN